MCMTKEKFAEIKQKYGLLDDDVGKAFDLVQEMLEAEVDATREKYPYATRSIYETEVAVHQVFDMHMDIENELFGDGE